MDDELKRRAAAAALDRVSDGMRLGLGSGSTAAHFVRGLGERVRAGLKVAGVPTSEATARIAREAGVPLVTLDETPRLDLAVDGADEIGPGLALVKGGGGALLREKIVAYASRRMIVIADEGKRVETLGRFPLPIEVTPFGIPATRLAVEESAAALGLAGDIRLRMRGASPFRTDGGNAILDAAFGRIPDPDALDRALSAIPGVVEHGLFIGLTDAALVATPDGGVVEIAA
jgi:ribose 5-phosphate isomerase A